MRYVYFMGHVCTANDDGSIPLNSRVVAAPARDGRANKPDSVVVNGKYLAYVLSLAATAGAKTPEGSMDCRPSFLAAIDREEDED